ncbi:MAG: hypothetical protein AB7G75_25885 [Candidatus Binatia bacterium]
MPSSLWTRTWTKVRYYRRGLSPFEFALRLLIDSIAKLGVRIELFHLVREGLAVAPALPERFFADKYEVAFLQPQDMSALAGIPGRRPTTEDLRQRLQDGKHCLAITRRGEIHAFTWCDLSTCRFEDFPLFSLQANEAYIFDAYTVETTRGQGLAPFMRYRLYEELAKLGRDRCYSITVLFNTPAARFKAKLGAQIVALHVFIELFTRWRWHRIVWRAREKKS